MRNSTETTATTSQNAAASSGMCALNSHGCVLLADAEFCDAAGSALYDIRGQSIWELFAETSQETRSVYEKARAGCTIASALLVRGNAHSQVECEVRLSPIALPDGDGVLVAIQDVRQAIASTPRRSGFAPASPLTRSEPALSGMPAELLHALIEASPPPIVAVASVERRVLRSPADERLFGARPSEVVGKPLPIDPQEQSDALDGPTFTERTWLHFADMVSWDGLPIPASVSAGPLCDVDGEVVGNSAALLNLREQLALKRELEATKKLFVELFEASPVAKILYRLHDRRIVQANRAFLKLARLSRDAVVGVEGDQFAQRFVPAADDRARLRAALANDSAVRDLEYHFRLPDGELREGLATVQPLDIEGERYILFVTEDVTEPRRVLGELRESNERFRQLAETMHDVFWLSLPDRKLIYVSPAYEHVFGRSTASLYANPGSWLDAVHHEDRERAREVFEGPASWAGEIEYRIVRADGTLRWIHCRAYPVRDASGRVIRIAGAAQDVTDWRALEAQLRQNQCLETIGLLASGVAHDFNNLLTVVLGSCDALRSRLGKRINCDEIVDDILCAGQRAAGLTRQLLAFSRHSGIAPRVVDLREVVRETAKLLRRLLGEDVTLTTYMPSAPMHVRADAGALGQVLMNLAVNARDAMPRGGSLRIRLARVQLSASGTRKRPSLKPGAHVILSVRDDGAGIPEQLLSRIFEPFFTTKEPGHGTGLGLSVTHRIVQQHGGHIEVRCAHRRGTTFRIFLPLITAAPRVVAATDFGALTGRERILLVEDDATLRRVAARVLSGLGYTVLEAGNGREALELFAAEDDRIALVITDVVMPEMSGHELAETLQSNVPQLRVLFTSGHADDALLRHGIVVSDVAFLRKPYTPIMLASKIREQLDH